MISAAIGVGFPYLLNIEYGIDSRSFGIIEGFFPVGMVIGALFVEKISLKIPFKKILFISIVICALMIMILGLPSFKASISKGFIMTYYISLACIFGICISFIDVPTLTYLQTVIEERFRGRIMSIGISIIKVVNPIAYILAGAILGRLNSGYLMIFFGLLLAGYTLFFKREMLVDKMKLVHAGQEDI